MKKISIMALFILLISIFAITASAAGVNANTDSKSCAQGSNVTLNVALSESVSAASGAVEVVYDSTKLELVEGTWNTSGAILSTFDMSKNKGAFAYASATSLSGKIFSVKFKVLSNAPVGDTEVKCIIQLKDASGNAISVTSSAGKLSITCNHSFTKKTTDHLASPASCTSAAKYYYTCAVCDEKGTNTFTEGAPTEHSFDKQIATAEYLVNSVTCVNEAEYYYSCSCGTKGTQKFTADASWSHNFSENLFISADGHWYQCIDCGSRKDFAGHIPNANNVCDKCQFVLSNDGTHYHSFGDAWVSNDDAHWHECSCGLKNDMELHNWDNGVQSKPAIEEEDGEKLYTCTDCGKTKTETIEKLDTEKTDDQTDNGGNSSDVEKPNNSEEPNDGVDIITVVIISILVAAVSVVCTVLVMKKTPTKNVVSDEDNQKDENSTNNENEETAE